jgi:hypothetical protein
MGSLSHGYRRYPEQDERNVIWPFGGGHLKVLQGTGDAHAA